MAVLKTIDLNKTFKIKTLKIRAVEKLNIEIDREQIFALVGESGSGKSTVARLLIKLIKPDSGHILFKGQNIWQMKRDDSMLFRKSVSIVFQDPYASLNPRMKIQSIVEEPLKIHGKLSAEEAKSKIIEIIKEMGFDETILGRYPHQLSGGQRQRVAIARALMLNPEILIADEPLSALDISLQASLLQLLTKIKENRKMGILFITHDLNIVRTISNRVAVMHLGRIVEEGHTGEIFKEPLHPYTRILMNSIPGFHRRNRKKTPRISTEERISWNLKGCRFFNRCDYKMAICETNIPELKTVKGRKVRCFLY
ncbi:ABC transporter ATP-binding protein [Thermodesulfovibrio sp. 3907-1M]|uniref:ABC transporter ATP-binding protein n=1 Tax=Thermodesulfovibrio autotrophicus TaxID=3118333 RepID=A0AAU8GXZ6_9BACT